MSFVKNLLLRMFGRPEGVLGRLGGLIMARTNRNIAARAIELLDVRPADKILEIGFGPGVGIQLLAGLVSSSRAVGIDYSAEMVAQARVRNVDAIRAGKVELRRGSAESLPFENDTFDKVLAINSMQVWPDIVAGLRETWRVVKPGGRIVFGFTRYSGQPKDGLAEMLTAAGFAAVQIVDIDQDFCALAIKPD